MTLKTCPRVTSPTGTVIGEPVSRTSVPRTRPSVGFREMARTMLSPRCWATSRVISWGSSPAPVAWTLTRRALYIAGMDSGGNSTSTTAPMMRVMRPVPGVVVSAMFVSSVSVSSTARGLRGPVAPGPYPAPRASAPETISVISWVMSPWRAALARRV